MTDTPTCILTGEPGENEDDCTTHDHEVRDYIVSVACTFEAHTAADAVDQMISFLDDSRRSAVYHVSCDNGTDLFLDAEKDL